MFNPCTSLLRLSKGQKGDRFGAWICTSVQSELVDTAMLLMMCERPAFLIRAIHPLYALLCGGNMSKSGIFRCKFTLVILPLVSFCPCDGCMEIACGSIVVLGREFRMTLHPGILSCQARSSQRADSK